MINFHTLGLCLILVSIASAAIGQDRDDTKNKIVVHGYLNAHWEYPKFFPDKDSGMEVMDFQIKEEKWQGIYFAPVNQAMIAGSDETICFRVIGQGYVAPRRQSYMQPWEGSQFIFVKIKKLKLLKSDAKCDPRSNTTVR
tara:strand:+ start:240 stop:659 length:420 start_codon:yes stop_codon:yes gene_type:complete